MFSGFVRGFVRRPKATPSRMTFVNVCPVMKQSRSSAMLPVSVAIDEERLPGYRSEHFFPVEPGQVFNNRYRTVAKIGWGSTSTVWLAEDSKSEPLEHVTLKIMTSDPDNRDMVLHELNMNERLKRDLNHPGSAFVRLAIDHFMLRGHQGTMHLCLVFVSMREPLSQYQHRLQGDRIPSQLLKVYVDLILGGLEYLHGECRVIHTDIKADNILMTFEDPAVINEYVQAQKDHPMPFKKVDGRNIYLSHNDFGRLKSFYVVPQIGDFGLAQQGDSDQILRHPIQAPLYHAPEVLLGLPWSYSVDIWSLGVLLFELLEDKTLFTHLESVDGAYTARAHLAEMIALLGPPSSKLIEQEKHWNDVPWDRVYSTSGGIELNTPREYYGGPFFDAKGDFIHAKLVPASVRLEDCITCMAGEEKNLFLGFVQTMLRWSAEDRPTATELRKDPWLQSGLE